MDYFENVLVSLPPSLDLLIFYGVLLQIVECLMLWNMSVGISCYVNSDSLPRITICCTVRYRCISANSALVTRSIVVDTFAVGKLFNVNKQILIFDWMEHADNRKFFFISLQLPSSEFFSTTFQIWSLCNSLTNHFRPKLTAIEQKVFISTAPASC